MQRTPPRRSGAEVDPLHPHHLVIHEGYTYLHSRMDGAVGEEAVEGLYDHDTRILSWHALRTGGRELVGVAAPTLTSDRWQAVLSAAFDDGDAKGPRLPQDAVEVKVDRRVGKGMSERFDVTNYSMVDRSVDVELELGTDFRDVGEVEGERRQHGTIDQAWDPSSCTLTWTYSAGRGGRSVERGLRVRVGETWTIPSLIRLTDDVPPDSVRVRLRFPLTLAPKSCRSLRLDFESLVDGRWRSPTDPETGGPDREVASRGRRREIARTDRPTFESPDTFLPSIIDQAADDLLALRNWDLEREGEGWIVNAGVPEFTGFFGRDTLTVGVQSALVGTAALRGALLRAAATQGTERDDFREEEPGRIVHEMRRGPLVELGIRPHTRYYGSHTGAAAFVFGLSEYWQWTADTATVARLRAAAERAMEWAIHLGDLDADGLLEYVQRSPEGLKNQSWKDSDEAIRYPDGRLVENPVATVEEQGYHFLALQRMAQLLVALDDDAAADHYLRAASAFRRLVEERFWLEDEGFYALAIDPNGDPVRTIASNPLHLLSAGLPAPDRARRVADRLMRPDLFNGWGVRTLSADHPSYNPFSYHLGSVWPVEVATFANGAKRYGFDDVVETLAAGLYSAAGHCHMLRLPEVLAGHGSEEARFPTTYPGAKSPQAWSASSTISMLQSLLGVMPFAPARMLGLVRPTLPQWLPELTVRGIRVGEAKADLRFERKADGSTDYEVVATDGSLRVARVPPPNATAAGRAERAAHVVMRAVPGRIARAGRIAMGIETG